MILCQCNNSFCYISRKGSRICPILTKVGVFSPPRVTPTDERCCVIIRKAAERDWVYTEAWRPREGGGREGFPSWPSRSKRALSPAPSMVASQPTSTRGAYCVIVFLSHRRPIASSRRRGARSKHLLIMVSLNSRATLVMWWLPVFNLLFDG